MDANTHLKNLLENSSKYELTEHDSKLLENSGIKAFIKNKLLSKKYRKWKASDEAIDRVEKAIEIATSSNKPLKVIYPQGGYKLWRLPSSPEIDWAEFFNISYVLNYLSPIIKAYTPGVELIYYMHTLVPEKHDNLTTEEINAYVKSFQQLIKLFVEYTPENVHIKISKDADFYDNREEYFQELESNLKNGKKDFEKMDDENKKIRLTTSELNLKLDGREDLTHLSGEKLKERIKLGAYYEKALSYISKPRPFTKAEDKVLIFSNAAGEFIGIGTTKSSITKYWIGFGVLVKHKDKFREIILSPKQYEKVSKLPHKVIEANISIINNLKEIMVFESLPNFSKQ